jgi:aspartate/methionine/tyrosine aminotransferase
LKTRKVDVKLAPGLRVGYIMGTGDLVPDAIEAWASRRICSPRPS